MTPTRGGPGPAGPVGVVTAVAGQTEALVAAALSGRRELVLVRRCADVAELLSVAEAGLAAAAVVGDGFPRLDADVVDRLRRAGCVVLGVVDPDRESSERLRAWALPVVEVGPVAGTGGPEATTAASALATALLAALSPGASGGSERRGSAVGGRDNSDPRSAAHPGPPPDVPGPGADGRSTHDPADAAAVDRVVGVGLRDDGAGGDDGDGVTRAAPTGGRGRVVAVWGPAGAPGRTTVAVTVAAELAADGAQVLLVDADTYASSIAQVLGLLDEAPGLVAAVRAGLDGRLDPAVLARLAPTVTPGLRVLTGLTRAARWSELRPAGLEAVLDAGRLLADHVVVDLATPLEEDEELSYDTSAPRRNGTTLDVLRSADDVLVVGSADPVGLQRLVRALQDLAVAVPGSAPQVVVNRVRADAVGRNPRLRVREALDRFAGVRDLRLVPDDRVGTDRALLAGRTLGEAAPDSPAREALQALARGLQPHPGRPVARRGRRSLATRR